MKTRKTDDDLIMRVRRTYGAVAESTAVGLRHTPALATAAEDSPRRSRRPRVIAVALAALVSAAAIVGVLAVRDGGIGNSEPKIRTPAGPDVAVPDAALTISDDVVLDLVAPVSNVSLRNADELSVAIDRHRFDAVSNCLEREFGFQNRVEFTPDRTRHFIFPDPDELRANGFHGPERAQARSGQRDEIERSDAYDEAAVACGQRVAGTSLEIALESLSTAWMEVAGPVTDRPEESVEWQAAAECLSQRGYAAEDLESESRFVGIGDRIGQDASLSDEEKEAHDVQLGNDYVDCAQNVWAARAAYLLEQRSEWATVHAAELEALTEQLRTTFATGE
jgi:hypothetical protein